MTPILRGNYSLIKVKDSMVRGRRNWYDLVGRPNTEDAVLIFSVKKVFLKFLQSSQENILARVSSFLIKLLLSSFFTQHLQRLLLLIAITWWKVYSIFKDMIPHFRNHMRFLRMDTQKIVYEIKQKILRQEPFVPKTTIYFKADFQTHRH